MKINTYNLFIVTQNFEYINLLKMPLKTGKYCDSIIHN